MTPDAVAKAFDPFFTTSRSALDSDSAFDDLRLRPSVWRDG